MNFRANSKGRAPGIRVVARRALADCVQYPFRFIGVFDTLRMARRNFDPASCVCLHLPALFALSLSDLKTG